MKGLVYENKTAQLRENIAMPQRRENETLVKISLAAVCSTDREIIKGYKPDFKGILGHEFVGIAEQSDDKSLIGKRVVGEINAGCQNCVYCFSGREKHCKNRETIGIVGKDGCFAEYMTIKTDLLHAAPDNVSDEMLVCTEPLAAALEVLQQCTIRPDDKVCIIGDGRLSFMIAQVVALNGADVYVSGHHRDKLEKFKSFANITVSPDDSFEIVIDACGSPSGMETAKKLCRSGGTIVLKSTYAQDIEMNLSWIVVNEITVKGSRCGPFKPALRLLEKNRITLPPIELYPIEKWQEAFNSSAFKVGFDFRG